MQLPFGYVLTDRIQTGSHDFVLGKRKSAVNPYAVWEVVEYGGGIDFYCGRFFQTREDALLDIYRRSIFGLEFPGGLSLGAHLLTNEEADLLAPYL